MLLEQMFLLYLFLAIFKSLFGGFGNNFTYALTNLFKYVNGFDFGFNFTYSWKCIFK